ncbi:alpha/beta fold hydrolase [Nonomuraea turcica]|uniref:alpha/beta fold hydrolase n=1 Tax=Nonomuraea sp. G32 TaxID=3067274 RepID=UPI00273B7B96|nr:alpha/beta hydrolase [Nonomuraea sp. G32]MDP4510093.1 alpha/beta hydrolase [Nonomuraea sp. G32]
MRTPLTAVLAIGLALTLTGAAVPQAEAGTSKPTVVLVHGAFADASGWNATIKGLQQAGYPVIAPANPLRDLPGDAAYVSSVLDTIEGPVVLVGHSYGGAVISTAAVGHANVKALVYVAAFAPDKGESALTLTGKYEGSELPQALLQRPYPGGVDLYIVPGDFRRVFAADVPASVTSVMAAAQRPASYAALSIPSTEAAWTSIPSWFLVAGKDRAIPAAAQRFMAKRAGARTVFVPEASHAVMVSSPSQTISIIKAAAHSTT